MSDWPLVKMQELASLKFNSQQLEPSFKEQFIFNSLAYENDWVTLENVRDVIANKKDSFDPKKALVIENFEKAFNFVMEMFQNGHPFDENKLKDIHEILMDNLGIGGLYRNVDISVRGSNHTPPSHVKVYDRMKKYFDTLNEEHGDLFEKIAYSHLQLVKIHPFLDGNGRCARLVLAFELMTHKLAPVIIPFSDKEKYFQMVEEYKVDKNILPFVNYLKTLEQTYLAS
ncbi:MAG: Fic family protein [Bacilli bacterium]